LPLRLIEEFLKETLTGNHKNPRKEEDKKQTAVSQCMTGLQNPKNCNKSPQKEIEGEKSNF
jgi:hypothetical protein